MTKDEALTVAAIIGTLQQRIDKLEQGPRYKRPNRPNRYEAVAGLPVLNPDQLKRLIETGEELVPMS